MHHVHVARAVKFEITPTKYILGCKVNHTGSQYVLISNLPCPRLIVCYIVQVKVNI